MSKPIMIIMPTINGYTLIPFSDNLLISMKEAEERVRCSRTIDELKEDIDVLYGEQE